MTPKLLEEAPMELEGTERFIWAGIRVSNRRSNVFCKRTFSKCAFTQEIFQLDFGAANAVVNAQVQGAFLCEDREDVGGIS